MKTLTSYLCFFLALLMIVIYFVPLWQIDLEAPQYPEGLGFEIWINKMSGDLRTVNGLNHYIGMKPIEPDSIPELKFMPYILGFLIVFGVITALLRKRKLLYTWFVLLLVTAIVGMIDFYIWEYDYGHNLNPEAAIKVPGMTYQPPLIGKKELLNFVAYSYPSIGGWLLLGVGLSILALIIYEVKFNNQKKKEL